MRFTKKLLAIVLMAVLISELFTSIRTKAAETGTPKFSVKYVNGKTGVKITIGKTEDTDGYLIYIKGYGTDYSNYWTDNGKNRWRKIGAIYEDGSKKRTYTITGLPKGTYEIKVSALVLKKSFGKHYHDGKYYNISTESDTKKVKIKAAKVQAAEEKTYDFSKAKVGDKIIFGSYEQDGIMTNGKEAIEWIVLSKSKTQMLVVSKYALDCLPYNTESTKTTWENCTLRKWLNGSFYKTAFTNTEKSMIKKTTLENADNPIYGTEGGNDTKDNVFLLSLDDMGKYIFDSNLYNSDSNRQCSPTAYTILNGVFYEDEILTTDGQVTCWYFLRTPHYRENSVIYICLDGIALDYGISVDVGYYAVRPAMWISLK